MLTPTPSSLMMEAASYGEAVATTTAATGALGPVLKKLGDLLCSESMASSALEGSRGDIEFIKSGLEQLLSRLLMSWEDKAKGDRVDADWMAQARILSYHLEDSIDGFCLAGAKVEAAASLFEGMRNQVQELLLSRRCGEKQWVTPAEAMAIHDEDDAPASPSLLPWKDASSSSELVEVDDKKAEIIKLLKHKEMVCICGSAGMGKTTLAGLAYQAEIEQFDCGAFVSVRPEQSMMHLLINIISEVVASAVIKATSAKRSELTTTEEATAGEPDDEQCLLDSVLEQCMMHLLISIISEVIASAVTRQSELTTTEEATGEVADDEQCLRDSILKLLTYRREEVTDSSAPDADDAKADGPDVATKDAKSDTAEKTDGSPVPITDSAPNAATGGDNKKKNLIDVVSTRFITVKRKLDASAQLTGAGVDGKKYLINIVSKLLGEKRKETSCVLATGTTDIEKDVKYINDILSEFLSDQRYLVIVDDIWEFQQWEDIRKSLVKNDRDSRTIIATRVNSVVEKCRNDDHAAVCEITGLSMDAAVALAEKIFKAHNAPPDKESCSSIAKISRCMPLAIICISAAVAQLLSPSAKNRFDVAICQALNGFAEIPCMKPLVDRLVLGYHRLPLPLKTCLLECSIYPPDQSFQRDDLIGIWLAEGFADEKQAPGYFEELVNWGYISIFRAEGVRHCRAAEYEITAVVLAFLRSQAQEHNFVASTGCYFSSIESLHGGRHSRMSVQGGLGSWDVSRLDFSFMRSLVVFGRASLIPFDRLSHLRVLHLDEEDTSLEGDLYDFPDLGDDDLVDICGLLLLRYLKLKGCKITKVPPQIGQLKLLETLDLRGTGVRELPMKIQELQRLETLNVSNTAVTHVPKEIGKLHMLKTLDISGTNVGELPLEIGNLQNLETLDVSNTMVKKLPRVIRDLQKLKTLHVRSIDIRQKELAEEIGQMQHLETLDISDTNVPELPMEIWKLQGLKTLNICNTNVRELPRQAGQRSNSISVVAGDKDSPKVVTLLEGAVNNCDDDKCVQKNMSINLFDRFGSSWEPVPVARCKIPGRHLSLPKCLSNKEKHSDISSLEISLWKLTEEDLEILQKMPNLKVLAVRVEVLPRTAITAGGFSKLESFFVDCRVPRLSFQSDAMPKLKHLQFKFYAFQATNKQEPMGIVHLSSLQRVDFRCASWYTTDAPGISGIINQVRKEGMKHRNRITVCINTEPEPAASTEKRPEPTGNDDIVDNGNSISVVPRSRSLPNKSIYFQ